MSTLGEIVEKYRVYSAREDDIREASLTHMTRIALLSRRLVEAHSELFEASKGVLGFVPHERLMPLAYANDKIRHRAEELCEVSTDLLSDIAARGESMIELTQILMLMSELVPDDCH